MLSHREASRAWGVSRATIQRAIKSGKLSLTADKAIDPSEMARVFGEPLSRPASRPAIPLETGVSHHSDTALLRAEIEHLHTLLAEKDVREMLGADIAGFREARAKGWDAALESLRRAAESIATVAGFFSG